MLGLACGIHHHYVSVGVAINTTANIDWILYLSIIIVSV